MGLQVTRDALTSDPVDPKMGGASAGQRGVAADYWAEALNPFDEAARIGVGAVTGERIPTDDEIAAETDTAEAERRHAAAELARRKAEMAAKRGEVLVYVGLGLAALAAGGIVVYAVVSR